MILEIDAGNTRIKWRLIREGAMLPAGVIAEGGVMARRKAPSVFLDLVKQLDEQPLQDVSRMRVCSVRGDDFHAAFSSLVSEKWQLSPEFAVVEKQSGGVTNSYHDVGKLGVDRWMAMLAAYNRTQGACCILDCGSAMTFDWLNGQGEHRGGYIVPGLEVMKNSLARKTPALDTAFAGWESAAPGNSTESAINNGILAMVGGFVRHCFREMENAGENGQWFLTGGDAELVGGLLEWPHQVEKDLVLDGLGIALKVKGLSD